MGNEAIQLIKKLCFGTPDDLSRPCEAVFIPGVSDLFNQARCVNAFAEVVRVRPDIRRAYIAGGPNTRKVISGREAQEKLSEAVELLRKIGPENYPHIVFLLEKKSTTIFENVTLSLPLGLANETSVICIPKAHAAGRCRLTLAKHAPGIGYVNVRHYCYDGHVKGDVVPVSAEHWHLHELHRKRVWGEFLRIRKYGGRGDIAFPRSVNALVEYISQLVHFVE